jgi:rRNA-processing protein FCF1
MVKVILDSNFLFVPFQFRIDIFEELEGLLGRYEPVVLSTTFEELESLLGKRSIKIRQQASAALELAKRCRIVEVEKKTGESYDDIVLRVAKEWKCPVATNDAALRKRLRETKVATIFLRQTRRLEIEGYPPH